EAGRPREAVKNPTILGSKPMVAYDKLVESATPAGSTILVVSKGDDELIKLPGRRGWHFPRDPSGVYAGFHPKDSQTAMEHLNALRTKGAQYLLLPDDSLWWLDHYKELGAYLKDRLVKSEKGVGAVYKIEDSK